MSRTRGDAFRRLPALDHPVDTPIGWWAAIKVGGGCAVVTLLPLWVVMQAAPLWR